jgi:3-oxoacyl-[acyl-carrier-protein] synthase II
VIVIAGTGLVTALGLSVDETWTAVQAGTCGVGPLTAVESPLEAASAGGQAPDLATGSSRRPREVAYLEVALAEALQQASLDTDCPYPADRRGIVLGTTLGGMRGAGAFLRKDDPGQLRSFLAASALQPLAASWPAEGFTASTSAACASGLASLGLACTLLASRVVDIVVAGGYDPLSEYAYAGFSSLRLVADGPQRPFTTGRDGMKLGEGYGLLVLERADDAARRGARVLAVIAGRGETSDAHHLTQPHPDGDGAARAMRAALADAGIEPRQIGLIAAHATATPDNDGAEHAALQSVFADDLARVPAVAFKSHLGHTLGGAGAVELILACEAMHAGTVPPTANVTSDKLEFSDLGLVTDGRMRAAEIDSTMNLSLGFGGANSCMILRRTGVTEPPPDPRPPRDVLITGVGVIAPGVVGNEAFRSLLDTRPDARLTQDSGAVDDTLIADLVRARRVRRMSTYAKLMLAATQVAMDDAGIDDTEAFAAECGALLGSTHGATLYSEAYYRQVVEQGIGAANPMLFAEAVPNVASAQLSLKIGLRGSAQTIIGSRTVGLDALQLAALRIASGEWDRAIVGAADEYSDVINRAYAHCGQYACDGGGTPFTDLAGFRIGAGAAALVLESAPSAAARKSRIRGRVRDIGATHGTTDVLQRIGDPPAVVCCASGSRLDRVEFDALSRSADRAYSPQRPLAVTTLYGYLAETFSPGPIAAVAAVLLRGRLPVMLASPHNWPASMRGADGAAIVDDFGVLCADHTGPVRAVRFSIDSGSAFT